MSVEASVIGFWPNAVDFQRGSAIIEVNVRSDGIFCILASFMKIF